MNRPTVLGTPLLVPGRRYPGSSGKLALSFDAVPGRIALDDDDGRMSKTPTAERGGLGPGSNWRQGAWCQILPTTVLGRGIYPGQCSVMGRQARSAAGEGSQPKIYNP